jgi:glycosyltransferase involved in cell wall biosynthesis
VRIIPDVRNRGERFTRAVWDVYQAALREDAKIYHFHDPELMLVGALLRMRGKRVIYDVHEDVGRDIGNKGWIPGLLRWPVSISYRALELAFTSIFDRVIAVTPAIACNFPARKTRLVRNFPWTKDFDVNTNLPYEDRDAIAVYAGGLHEERGLREMRQAVELAAKEVPIKLVVAGWVNPGEKDEFLRDGDSESFEFKGMLNRAGVAELLGRARVGMLLFYPLPNHVNAMPTKLFEYMAAGLPMIVSDFPSWRELIGREECALFVNPLSPASVAEALLWLFRYPTQAAQMGQNGRRAVAEKFNWERESERLLATYAELEPVGREKAVRSNKEGTESVS